jgi:hypothetical protein
MSHIKNVEAFGKLIGICTGLGENYTPGQPKLSVSSLNSMLANARMALDNVQSAASNVAGITNTRERIFENMRKQVFRVLSELKSSGVSPQTLADARSLQHKLAGYRASRDPVATDTGEKNAEPKAGKSSRTPRGADFITKVETFNMLIKLVKSTPGYDPVREELKIASLEATSAALAKANDDVGSAYATFLHARMFRNEVLYRGTDNMVELSRLVKTHVRAMAGFDSEAYKAVSKIPITVPTIV